MSQMILDCQKELVAKIMESNPEKLLYLILNQEANSIMEMTSSEIVQVSDSTTQEEFLQERFKFWESEIKNKSQESFNSIVSLLKGKIKEMPQGFDFINKLIIEENIH